MHADAATVPELSHPVADVLRERARAGSAPGARRDPHTVALVLEGGGMRGVVSAGMAAAIERLGLTASFDLVVGSSAGAINAGALIAGVARGCAAAYHGPFASRTFVNPDAAVLGQAGDERGLRARLQRARPRRRAPRPRGGEPDRSALRRRRRGHRRRGRPDRHAHQARAVGRDPGLEPDAVGRRRPDRPSAGGATSTAGWPRRSRWSRPSPPGRRTCSRCRPAPTACRARARRGWPIASSSATCASSTPRSSRSTASGWPTTRRRSRTSHGARTTPARAAVRARLRPPAGTPVVSQIERRPEILAQAAADAERLVEQALA